MIKLQRSLDVDRPAEEVFALIADPVRFPEFFSGLTRWELCSEKERGMGAEFRVLMRVGSIEAGGVIRLTDWQEPRTIAWKSLRGIDQHGRWVVTPHEDGSTELSLEIAFDLRGGLPGRLVERLVSRIVGGNMSATLRAARRILTYEEREGLQRVGP
ncbi:MAG: type II toxin-antitoxin system RatA family toxin [Actinomycetota bacterium]